MRPVASDRRLERLQRALPRRRQHVVIGGMELEIETLDDLDAVIDRIMRERPPAKDPARGVAEVCPHFGVVWPSALGLGEHLAERLRSGALPRSTLELGCGLALPSMVARRLGVPHVVVSDRHPLVSHFIKRHAEINRLGEIAYRHMDWRQPTETTSGERFDLLLGSDLLYEPWQPGFLARALVERLTNNPDATAWIADPGRRYVETFAQLIEAEGLSCELSAVRPIAFGRSTVDVMILEIKRHPGD